MKRMMCFCLLCLISLVGCSKNENTTKLAPVTNIDDAVEKSTQTYPESFSLSKIEDISSIKELKFNEVIDPIFWNNSMQEGVYINLFNKKDIKQIIKFREFIESLASLHSNEPIYEYNPVILAINSYPEMLSDLFNSRPDLFLHGSTDYGNYSVAPIIFALRNGSLDNLKFFFDHNISWDKSHEMYGSRNMGGSEYFLGGTLLTDARNKDTIDYLISKGFKEEENISDYDIYICQDVINLFETQSFNSKIVTQLNKNIKITGISITLYKSENYQWIKLQTQDGIIGWAPLDMSISYNTGI